MANIDYLTSNRLRDESFQIKSKARNRVLLIAIPFTVAAYLLNPLLGVVTLLLGLYFWINQKGSDIIDSGAHGEDLALTKLKRLSNDFTLFNQIDIPSEKSSNGMVEADLVVSGPTALFVIEVKNNNGEIFCDESAQQWQVIKIGRGGTRYEKQMRNPIKQVKNQAWLLRQYLKTQKASAWIQPLVVFTHPNANLVGSHDSKIPVLSIQNLNNYIHNFQIENSRPVRESTITALAALK